MGGPRGRAGVAPIFDPGLHLSPYTLFRHLRDGDPPEIVDLREAVPTPRWRPSREREVLLVDDDGTQAEALARRLREKGFENVFALFGGLKLYDFALDPAVVGQERYLVQAPGGARPGGYRRRSAKP